MSIENAMIETMLAHESRLELSWNMWEQDQRIHLPYDSDWMESIEQLL